MNFDEKPIEEELSYPILLSERLRKAINDAVSFKSECSKVGLQVDRISNMLRSAVRTSTSSTAGAAGGGQIYDRPIRRIAADVTRNFHRSLAVVQRCRRRNFFHRVVQMVTTSDFRKILGLLEASAGDMRWLLSILDGVDAGDGDSGGKGIVVSLAPIASNDPILSWVWSFTASVQMGQVQDRIEAANQLGLLAKDSDRNKKIIVEEGGIPPLLKLLKENSSPDAQIAAAIGLFNLGNCEERVRVIVNHMGIPLIVHVLSESSMRVQIRVSNLVGRMAEYDSVAKEEFARENVIRPLVSLLAFETFEDDDLDRRKFSFHSIVQLNKDKNVSIETSEGSNSRLNYSYSMYSEGGFISKGGHNKKERENESPQVKKELKMDKNVGIETSKRSNSRLNSSYSMYSEGGSISKGGHNKKERENESPQVKKELKISCAKALWMLAKDCVSNSRRITETKGLLCLAKLIEKQGGELQKNCLMTIMEITLSGESNADLRRSAFKTNSPAAKAVVQQLLRVIKESNNPTLEIPAIKSIGHLSRIFPAKDTQVIGPLVHQLSNNNPEVATEAAIALGKFTSPDNFLCQEHSRAIIEFEGVLPLMRLLRASERAQVQGLVLLCYLAIHASNNEALEQARVLNALEGADRTSQSAQSPQLRELITKAMYHLNLYRKDIPIRQPSFRIY